MIKINEHTLRHHNKLHIHAFVQVYFHSQTKVCTCTACVVAKRTHSLRDWRVSSEAEAGADL